MGENYDSTDIVSVGAIFLALLSGAGNTDVQSVDVVRQTMDNAYSVYDKLRGCGMKYVGPVQAYSMK